MALDLQDSTGAAPAAPFADTLTITLRAPIVFAGVTYDHIDLREPTAAEWEQWDSLEGVAANVKAVSVVSGLPDGAVKQIGVRDFSQAVGFIKHFF